LPGKTSAVCCGEDSGVGAARPGAAPVNMIWNSTPAHTDGGHAQPAAQQQLRRHVIERSPALAHQVAAGLAEFEFAKPKSVMTARTPPSGDRARITLLHFKSPWITPCRCACARPAQTCRAISRPSFSPTGPARRMRSNSVSPSDELHHQEIHLAHRGSGHVQVMHLANVEVAHLACRPHFRRQAIR